MGENWGGGEVWLWDVERESEDVMVCELRDHRRRDLIIGVFEVRTSAVRVLQLERADPIYPLFVKVNLNLRAPADLLAPTLPETIATIRALSKD